MRIDDAVRTLRQAARSLARRPVLAIVGLTTLALGIGANTAMFSVINVVFLKPLPFREPERLAMVWSNLPDQNLTEGFNSYPDFKDWREQSKLFSGLAAFWMFPNSDVNLTGGSEPQRVSVARVTPDFFNVLGVRPLLGRGFQEEETILGNHRRAILSYGTWRDHFGGDSTLVGRDVMVNGVPYVVVGIMPRDLQARAVGILGTDVQLWRPLVPEDNQTGGRGSRRLRIIGRLAPGATAAQGQAELTSIALRLGGLYPETNRNMTARVIPLRDQIVRDVRRGLFFLLGAVAVVLLGACANVANLLLIKAAGNRKQLAVQHALGASRMQLSAQVLSEALLLGVAGAVLGLVLAFGILRTFVAYGPADIPLLADARIDLTVLAFTLVATLVAVVLAALLPAWQAGRPDGSLLLRQSATRARDRDERRTMRTLSISQIALAMVLLSVGALLVRGFVDLLRVDPGIRANGVLTFQVELPMAATAAYPTQPQRDVFFETLISRLAALPGVSATTLATAPPVEEAPTESALRLPSDPEGRARQASFRLVGPDYFALLGIPIQRGRPFATTDVRSSPRVVIVSDALARSIWPSENPIGKRIMVSARDEAEIVGVAGDVRASGLDAGAGRTVYIPTTQGTFNFMTLLVRTRNDPLAMVSPVRSVVREMDAQVPLHHVRTLSDIVASSVAHQRFQMLLVTAFSILMLLLAVVGTYGVMAYGVTERTKELGIRAALGASSGDIRALVLGEGGRIALIGILIGTIGGAALSAVMTRLIVGLASSSVSAFLIAPLILGAAVLVAAYLPAQRAASVDPMKALRAE